jgi:hypothetical protein
MGKGGVMKFNAKTTAEQVLKAIEIINSERYNGKIIQHPDSDLTKRKVRLRVKECGLPFTLTKGKRSRNACWHVHGDFFDALFSINPHAVVWSRGERITKEDGNWKDYAAHIVHVPYPGLPESVLASQLCDCER